MRGKRSDAAHGLRRLVRVGDLQLALKLGRASRGRSDAKLAVLAAAEEPVGTDFQDGDHLSVLVDLCDSVVVLRVEHGDLLVLAASEDAALLGVHGDCADRAVVCPHLGDLGPVASVSDHADDELAVLLADEKHLVENGQAGDRDGLLRVGLGLYELRCFDRGFLAPRTRDLASRRLLLNDGGATLLVVGRQRHVHGALARPSDRVPDLDLAVRRATKHEGRQLDEDVDWADVAAQIL
mmetsp:Transcript_22799/g.73074  ORF Transcript_22799/g.73074 Transcript_22799/m.73074 type:complete len:238 (+) Transcript_22799:288-1001(+)